MKCFAFLMVGLAFGLGAGLIVGLTINVFGPPKREVEMPPLGKGRAQG